MSVAAEENEYQTVLCGAFICCIGTTLRARSLETDRKETDSGQQNPIDTSEHGRWINDR